MNRLYAIILFSTSIMLGCSTKHYDPIATVDYVDLDRFMGDWYVIANIPTFLEEGAHNAIETYEMNEDGTVATTFTFYDGGFDGDFKRYTPKGFIEDDTGNAIWGMQFIWPIKAEYRVIYLDEDYQTTIIGRSQRDYVWLMSRDSQMDDEYFNELVEFIGEQGYDTSLINKVPQRWTQSEDATLETSLNTPMHDKDRENIR